MNENVTMDVLFICSVIAKFHLKSFPGEAISIRNISQLCNSVKKKENEPVVNIRENTPQSRICLLESDNLCVYSLANEHFGVQMS